MILQWFLQGGWMLLLLAALLTATAAPWFTCPSECKGGCPDRKWCEGR